MNTHIKRQRNLTTTFPEALLQELDTAAKELHTQKNEILANAFIMWNKRRKQEQVSQSYKKIAQHKDLLALADEGLEDWNKTVEACK